VAFFCGFTVWARIANPRYRSRVYLVHIKNVGFDLWYLSYCVAQSQRRLRSIHDNFIYSQEHFAELGKEEAIKMLEAELAIYKRIVGKGSC
jgi:hypothetical protein